jgi:membrane dipeptidase
MNRLGIVIDLSHVGPLTTKEAIEVSKQPVCISHANPKALKDHVRNKTDEQVRALVQKCGVIGANIFPPFLRNGYDSTLEDFLDAIDYWVQVAGVDHVAFGLDFTEDQSQE